VDEANDGYHRVLGHTSQAFSTLSARKANLEQKAQLHPFDNQPEEIVRSNEGEQDQLQPGTR